MRKTLTNHVRRRSSVLVGSAGLATVIAASAVALAIPTGPAVADAPTVTTVAAAGHPDALKIAPVTATRAIDTGKLGAAPYLKPTPAAGGHTVAAAPYLASGEAKPAAPAAQPVEAPAAAPQAPAPAAPAEQAPAQPAPQPAAPAPAPQAAVDTSPSGVRALAQSMVPAGQWAAFSNIINHESSWNLRATNPSSGSYGLGQALPAGKMASAGSDWRTNPVTQIKWTLGYMNDRYGSPNAAWAFWQNHHWY
ncbi:aggregation-promoting factor C-terminal-like domain-containing protein [Kitasatospora mediocidica]|uniref:aggregation-promoting factor C-terminal-like domain-containing protein n=1 Tax=Kitasatospora mediocidica TaxID=58352 RepID=UPI000A7AB6C4|nr:transglycosylase SLT domain-containing protein [Kitasatospora mediocidica]